ncbi:hypothetical protein K435DRAFT_871612 [Dendrothele bispora CBS 962.96]|uniref:Uncharacterized protein n=1 Tax=Dendrothele bispora (strain CBS 962.96) TaxID=1314807 RepID=A0A4S8L3R9_DENBC|nr:hypothetical protein K435DRAFT_871612 [Dendrothele bispora CBS 962.96]
MPVMEEVSQWNTLMVIIVVGGSVADCSTALSLIRQNPDASAPVLDNADTSLFKEQLSEDISSYLAPHLPVEELLQDTFSSSEAEANHYHYSLPIFTRSSSNACV